MKTIKQFSESKATEKGERDVGSKAYTDYVIDMTPGAVSNTDAKKSDRETKKTNALKIHRATRLDDAIDPEIEQANAQYEREKDELRKQHIKNVANIRSNKIGENLVPDPVPADVYNYTAKKGAIAAPGSGSIAKARKAKTSDTNKSIEQQMADARKEGWEELDPSDVLIEYDQDEVEEGLDTWHPEPEKDRKTTSMKYHVRAVKHHDSEQSRQAAKKRDAEKSKKEEATYSERISSDVPAGNASKARGTSKARKFKQVTPGQVRDYEKLSAARMFQAYEDAPANATGPNIANWDPLLGGENSPRVYVRKRRKIDARSKDYREAIKRTQARRDAVASREAEHKLNMFGVQSNPFKEETEMKNKKYLTTKEGSIEAAVVKSVGTETPVNPNDARPTLHLPNKYLASKTDSLENAVTQVMTEKDVSGEMRFDIKRLTGPQFRNKYRMTKQAAMTPGGGVTHKKGKAVLHHEYEPQGTEIDENGKQHPGQKKGSAKLKKGWGMTQSGEPYFKPNSNNPTRDKKDEEVEMDEKEDKRIHYPSGRKETRSRDRHGNLMPGWKNVGGPEVKKATKTASTVTGPWKTKEDVEMDESDIQARHGTHAPKGVNPAKLSPAELDAIRKRRAEKAKEKLRHEDVEVDETHAPGHDQKSSIGTPLKHKRSWNKDTHKLITLPNGSVKVVKKDVPGQEAESVEFDEKKDSRRTDDAIDAYDKSKDASRDADWDTEHGKKKKGDKEKKYAKKERGEIDKDDPDWKHKKGHTGMHGEEKRSPADAALLDKAKRRHAQDKRERDTEKMSAPKEEMNPLIQATIDELSKKTLGRYAMASQSSAVDAGMALQRTADKNQTRGDVDKHVGTLNKRRQGLKKAVQKLSKEDVEIDELSKKTLGSYVKKASDQQYDLGQKVGDPTGDIHGKERRREAGAKAFKRHKGVRKAADKLSKEEVEMDEDKLSYKERQNLPKGAFALPGKGSGPEGKQGGSYPIPDESHARNALARVSQHGSEAEKATVRRAVHKKFPDIKVSEGVMRDLLSVELDETHTPKDRTALDKAIDTYKEKGGKTTVLKPGTRLKGMDPSRKAVIKARRSNEEVEIDEARSVESAMSIISSIVKNKQAGEIIHGDRKKSKVDLYSASAIQQVYNALNRKNQEKMEKVISKNRQGLAKMADFSMSMMK